MQTHSDSDQILKANKQVYKLISIKSVSTVGWVSGKASGL